MGIVPAAEWGSLPMPRRCAGARMGTAPDDPGSHQEGTTTMQPSTRLAARAALASAFALALAILSASAAFAGGKFP
jgi:hypothetical protein